MKKGIILLVLLFTACVNLENIGGNSGGDVKEIKTTNINTTKNYEKRNGVLYVDNVLANGKQEYKEKNGVIIKGNYREGLPDGVQEKYYPSGKIYGKINIINNKTDVAVYHENGKEVFSNSDEGVKINGEAAEKSLLDMFSKDKLLKTALYLLTSNTVQAEYKNGKPSIGQLMQVEDRNRSGRNVKVYDKAGNLIADTTYTKEHEIRQIF